MSTAAAAAHSDAPSQTVLVVDDEEVIRDLLTRMLTRAGYKVVSAVHGSHGLERFREMDFDVVITDILMPEMDGIELIEALTREKPDVKVIAVSGIYSRARHLRRAKAMGAKATLLKPVARADLVETVEQVIAENVEGAAARLLEQARHIRTLAEAAPMREIREKLLAVARDYELLAEAADVPTTLN